MATSGQQLAVSFPRTQQLRSVATSEIRQYWVTVDSAGAIGVVLPATLYPLLQSAVYMLAQASVVTSTWIAETSR